MKNIAVVTGASSGMGKEFALTLKDHGSFDEVWLIARGARNLGETAKQIPIPAKIVPLDLTDRSSFEQYADLLKQEEVSISLLINASGFGIFESVENTSEKNLDDMVDLNCKALMKMTKLSLPYMSEGSRIIQIASMASFQPIPYIDVYGATKAFVLSFSRALNQELKKRKIHCMAVCPYWTKTKFFDRAVAQNKDQIVKYYAVMYTPEQIITRAWKDLEKGKDLSIYGFVAKAQALLCKLLPHKIVMYIWKKQQKLD
ncbi:MAG: SDR family NAD(P)-dependent oxidoreductase [Erysipelotrichaceae bacterium]|nr:SDR family NAD(P)-dependent oxidoreductase [Erysipelotrichaceae bacterium]